MLSQEYFTTKTLDDYKAGFGDVTKEFFIGLDRLYKYEDNCVHVWTILNITFAD